MPSFPIVSLGDSDMPDSDSVGLGSSLCIENKPKGDLPFADAYRTRKLMARAIGKDISEHEPAIWSCSKEEEHESALRTAAVVMFCRSGRKNQK